MSVPRSQHSGAHHGQGPAMQDIHGVIASLSETIAQKDNMIAQMNERLQPQSMIFIVTSWFRNANNLPELQKMLADSQEETNRFRQHIQLCNSQYHSLSNKHDTARKRVDELQTESNSLKDNLKQTQMMMVTEGNNYKQEMSKLETDKEDLRAQIGQLKEQLMAKELAESADRNIANSKKISDDVIRRNWETMAYNIKVTAKTLLTHCPSMKELTTQHEGYSSTLMTMTPEDYQLLQDKDLRSLVVQRYIWMSVVNGVFGRGQPTEMQNGWAGASGREFSNLYRLLNHYIHRDNDSEFQHWKATTSDMIERLTQSDKDEISELTQAEVSGFSKLLPVETQNIKGAFQNLFKQLQKVYVSAVELHSIFMKSKARFEVLWIKQYMHDGYTVKSMEKYMDVMASGREVDDTTNVLFDVSPALLKYGNADGHDYETHSVLIKDQVVCD